ncbi:MAG: hypothetical protein QXX08_07825 [Candidatus Bathyarchaeia archaeon]
MAKNSALKGEGIAMPRKPSCVKASIEVAAFINSLREGSYLLRIVNSGLDVLKENMFAGDRIERRKIPKYYVQKYGVNNLYKVNLDSRTRLIYTLVADESGVAVVVLEILDHKKYEERFGYS